MGGAAGLLDQEPMECPVGFEYLGHKGSLQVFYKGSPRRMSHMRVGFVSTTPFVTGGFVRVVTSPAFGLLLNPSGWSPIDPGDARLRDHFVVYASSPTMAKELAPPGRIEAFEAIARDLGGFAAAISFGKSTLVVEKVCHSARPQEQLRLIYRVIDLLEVLVGIPARTVGRIDAGRAPQIDLSGATCQICMHPLSARVVFCQGCVTPHHQECWEYVGGCSTYACLRRAFTVGDYS